MIWIWLIAVFAFIYGTAYGYFGVANKDVLELMHVGASLFILGSIIYISINGFEPISFDAGKILIFVSEILVGVVGVFFGIWLATR